jgi:glycerophosphoryl diester phosphodiesterase
MLPFTAMLAVSAIIWLYSGDHHRTNREGFRISANKAIFTPGDEMRISASVKASRIKISIGDLYLAVQDPAGHFRFYYDVSGWRVINMPSKEMASIMVNEIGPYSVFFVLCYPGLDPYDPQNWVSGVSENVFVLPKSEISSSEQQNGRISLSRASNPILIAHGAGEIENLRCTNTLEALDQNYTKGYRYFEIDLCWTTDRRLVLIHDWKKTFKTLFMNAKAQPTLENFESMRMVHNLTQMPIRSLYRWLSKHHDAYIITDVKTQNLKALSVIAKTAGVLLKERFIPQIYNPNELKPVEKMGFKDVILTLYRSDLTDTELFKFVNKNSVFAVTIPVRKAFSFGWMGDLRKKGVSIYAHTVNRIDVFEYLRKKGVYGVYTDTILPDDIQMSKP